MNINVMDVCRIPLDRLILYVKETNKTYKKLTKQHESA